MSPVKPLANREVVSSLSTRFCTTSVLDLQSESNRGRLPVSQYRDRGGVSDPCQLRMREKNNEIQPPMRFRARTEAERVWDNVESFGTSADMMGVNMYEQRARSAAAHGGGARGGGGGGGGGAGQKGGSFQGGGTTGGQHGGDIWVNNSSGGGSSGAVPEAYAAASSRPRSSGLQQETTRGEPQTAGRMSPLSRSHGTDTFAPTVDSAWIGGRFALVTPPADNRFTRMCGSPVTFGYQVGEPWAAEPTSLHSVEFKAERDYREKGKREDIAFRVFEENRRMAEEEKRRLDDNARALANIAAGGESGGLASSSSSSNNNSNGNLALQSVDRPIRSSGVGGGGGSVVPGGGVVPVGAVPLVPVVGVVGVVGAGAGGVFKSFDSTVVSGSYIKSPLDWKNAREYTNDKDKYPAPGARSMKNTLKGLYDGKFSK